MPDPGPSALRIFTHFLTLFFLLSSLVLTLLPLLPSPLVPLFSIRPTGLTRAESPLVADAEVVSAWGYVANGGYHVGPAVLLPTGITGEVVNGQGEVLNGLTYGGRKRALQMERGKRLLYTVDEAEYEDVPSDSAAVMIGSSHLVEVTPVAPLGLATAGVEGDGTATPPINSWLGESGPEVDVGVASVCWRTTRFSERVCSWMTGYEASAENALLPPDLRTTLEYYPTTSPAPVILVISLAFQILAVVIYVFGLLRASVRRLSGGSCFPSGSSDKERDWEKHVDTGSDTESLRTLVPALPRGGGGLEGAQRPRWPWGFFTFWVSALGCSIAGCTLILLNVAGAKERWDEDVARDVGMVWALQPAAILVAAVPGTLLFGGMLGLCPSIIHMVPRSSPPSLAREEPAATSVGRGRDEKSTSQITLADLVNNWEKYHGPVPADQNSTAARGNVSRSGSMESLKGDLGAIREEEKRDTFGVEREDRFHWQFKL